MDSAMYEHQLEDIHRLIDTVEQAIRKINKASTDSIQVQQIPELSEAIIELLGWTNTAYVENQLGINPSLLSKFVKMRGAIRRPLAAKVADRLRSYLKSEDQASLALDRKVQHTLQDKEEPRKPSREPTFRGEQWVEVRTSSEIKLKIGAVSALLDSIIIQTRGSNEPPEHQILSDIERQQLIAILETALNILKSPLAEKGLLKKAQSILKRGAESAAQKGVQQGLGWLMLNAAARIGELLGLLFK